MSSTDTENNENSCQRMTKEEIKFQEKIKSTKFVLSVGVLVLNTFLLMHGFITPQVFSDIVQLAVGAYILGDVAQNTFVQSKWSR